MKRNEEMDGLEGEGAKFNMGLAMTMRLDQLFKDAAIHARRGELTKWYDDLLCIERECSSEMKSDDPTKVIRAREKVVTTLERWCKQGTHLSAFDANNSLHNYEVVLRKVIKDRGLGMQDKEDDDGL